MAATLGSTEYNTRADESVVYLPGALVGKAVWHSQIRALPDHHQIFVDLPGCDAQIRWRSFDHAAECVRDTIAASAHDGRAHVVGLSLGAFVGARLLATDPEAVRSAVLTGLVAEDLGKKALLQQLPTIAWLGTQQLHRSIADDNRLPVAQVEQYIRDSRQLRRWDHFMLFREVCAGLQPDDLRDIAVPTLTMAGENEAEFAHRAARRIADAMDGGIARAAPGVGHSWNVEKPELFNDVVRRWISTGEPHPDLIEI